jgi:ATP-dependent DNA helicase RecG
LHDLSAAGILPFRTENMTAQASISQQLENAAADADPFKQPVTRLPGVAGRRAALLGRLGIETWFDLLSWFPRDFEDWTALIPLGDLTDGSEQTFLARVARKPSLSRKGRLSILRTVLRDEGHALAAVWFNQPYLADRLIPDQWYQFRGKVKRSGQTFSVQNPSFEPCDPDEAGKQGIRPIYPLTEGLSQGVMRQMIQTVLPRLSGRLPEPLPAWVRKAHNLCAVEYAYSRIHQPSSWEEAAICRRRLAFEELFLLQAGLFLLRRLRQQTSGGWPVRPDAQTLARLNAVIQSLPFQLTGAQQRTWSEIQADLANNRPMNRLVQGDVGSGKTVIAALAMLQCALCGYQAVLMAPTAILARQHHQTLSRLLERSGEPVALLTGATPVKERRQMLAALAAGQIRLLVGTHALIEDKVRFQNLALAVTDEQHRFGVRQRIRLSHGPSALDSESVNDQDPDPAKPSLSEDQPPENQPHILVMSATPIPRTLGLILYGDLDISVIDQLPAGRRPIETYTAATADRERLERLIRRFVQEGRQVYVVCPMIDENAETDLESAVSTFNRLAQDSFPDLRLGLLHGALKPTAKDQVMDAFMRGEIQILVSTTVIEVGVDNPNAALMMIENAERFGLAQLHQLRGRIGRGRPPLDLCPAERQ